MLEDYAFSIFFGYFPFGGIWTRSFPELQWSSVLWCFFSVIGWQMFFSTMGFGVTENPGDIFFVKVTIILGFSNPFEVLLVKRAQTLGMRIVKTSSIKELSCPVNRNDMTVEGLGCFFSYGWGASQKIVEMQKKTNPTSGGKNMYWQSLELPCQISRCLSFIMT